MLLEEGRFVQLFSFLFQLWILRLIYDFRRRLRSNLFRVLKHKYLYKNHLEVLLDSEIK